MIARHIACYLVLGLLLLGILILLFVPVRYELSAEGDIHTPEEIRVSVSIRYFFRLITFHTVYENQKFLAAGENCMEEDRAG